MDEYNKDYALADAFVTALEGGIGYWSACSAYRWSLEGREIQDLENYRAIIHDEGVDGRYVITKATMATGFERFAKWAKNHSNSYFQRAADDIHRERWNDLDIDADIADVIVQLALFDQLVYG